MANSSFLLGNDSWYDHGGVSTSGTGIGFLARMDENKDALAIAKMVVQAIDIVDLTNRLFKNKLLEEMRTYFADIV
jgi:hypothetical protein